MQLRDTLIHVGGTVIVLVVAVLVDAALGGADTVGWVPPLVIVLGSAVLWFLRWRRHRVTSRGPRS